MDVWNPQQRAREAQEKRHLARSLLRHRLATVVILLRGCHLQATQRGFRVWRQNTSQHLNVVRAVGLLGEALGAFGQLLSEKRGAAKADALFQIRKFLIAKRVQSSLRVNEQSLEVSHQQELDELTEEAQELRDRLEELELEASHIRQLEEAHRDSRSSQKREARVQAEIRTLTEDNQRLQEKLSLMESNIDCFMKEMNQAIEAQRPAKKKAKRKASRNKISVVSTELIR